MAPAVAGPGDGIIERLVAADTVRWWNKPNLRRLYLLLVPFCLFIESTSGFDSSMMNGMQALNYWQEYFGHPKGGQLGLLVACYNLGAITSIPFVAIVSDHLGRRKSIVLGSTIMIIGAIMQGLSQNLAMFIFSRIFLGHGIVYAIISGAALLGELGHPKERAFLGSMFNAFFGVGSVLGAGIVVRTLLIPSDWSWRLPSILQAIPSVIQIVFALTVPESPRWLVSKDRSEEALEILIKYHAEGDASAELPHIEIAEIRKALELENESRQRGWAELFQSKGMRHRAVVAAGLGIFVQYSGNNLISQYLVPILKKIGIEDSHTQVRYNVGSEAWGFLMALVMASVSPRFPRRRMYLLCASCLLCVYTAWTIAQARNRMTGSKETGYAVLVMIFSTARIHIATRLTTSTWSSYPYYVRHQGPFMVSTLQQMLRHAWDLDWKFLFVYIALLSFEIVFIYFLFPETYGKTLEELTFLFESEKQDREALAVTTAKILGQDGNVTEIHEAPEKKA
ncbi:lactose permease [Pyrenophora tritici-repentis Pt-1C-BFP]|uniref:Lactose permease n=1 Tax=Pyrenophora tritici-repentis (strain Pt-1C-BFP) TaxID=426418 RepID=B2VW73_PYRTR|nr:lactose permease [Pyrenophora tritici-repentis Pt-1C-BFP]EDU40873.1 lactose permease [Pyrenophora tritici-repentis Pt-1C-BFP]